MSIHIKECKVCHKEIGFAEWVYHNEMCKACDEKGKIKSVVGDFVENEFERIKSVLDLCQTNEEKIAFLLRQVEWLLKTRDSCKK